MKIMKTLKYTLGMLLIAGAAMAANIALRTGPVDVADLRSIVNQMVVDINAGTAGLLNVNAVSTANSGTSEATIYSYTMPANYLSTAGQSVRVRCSATSGGAGAKTLKLYFGTASITSGSAANTVGGYLEYVVTRTAAATETIVGTGLWGAAGVTPVVVQAVAGTEALTADVLIKCTGTDAVSTETVGKMLLVETIR